MEKGYEIIHGQNTVVIRYAYFKTYLSWKNIPDVIEELQAIAKARKANAIVHKQSKTILLMAYSDSAALEILIDYLQAHLELREGQYQKQKQNKNSI